MFIVVVLILSSFPILSASIGGDNTLEKKVFSTPTRVNYPIGSIIGVTKLDMESGSFTGSFADDYFTYSDMDSETGLGLTNGGSITMAIELTDIELAGFYGGCITDLNFDAGSDGFGPVVATPYEIWIEPGIPDYSDIYTGGVNVVHVGVTNGAQVQQSVVLGTPWNIPVSGNVSIGITYTHVAGEYPCGIDEDSSTPNRGALVTYDGLGQWDNLSGIGFAGRWCIEFGFSDGSSGPDNCIDDECDFDVTGFSSEFEAMSIYDDVLDAYYWNSLPKTISFSVVNNGEIGISEVKILVDIYEKICGPTSEIFCDEKYDIQLFDVQPSYPYTFEDWQIMDDLDGDSWVLQGGADNRWLTNNQAWRNTIGEDRSFGDDADVYLGKNDNPAAAGVTDDLITPGFDIAGAACAKFSFSHWVEGEYTFDYKKGNIIPIDYGRIAYSLDGGVTWVNVSLADFLAYDTSNEWEDVTMKFINTAIDAGDDDYMHSYATVCDDCVPEEGDILIETDFPLDAELMIKFIWDKDPCLQFEGWYIDNICVQRTEDYYLELAYQGHVIMELDPCDPELGPVGKDIEFPLDWDPNPDTWYELWAHGQVFSPIGCEVDVANNWFKTQFKITDIHDMVCMGMEMITPNDGTCKPGDPVLMNVTVKNNGVFTEEDIEVNLLIGDLVVDWYMNNDFETDPSGKFNAYYLPGDPVTIRWSKGDPSIDYIFTNDPAQARSKKPGNEALIFAEEGTLPYYWEGEGDYLEIPGIINLDRNDNGIKDYNDPISATFNFEAKWSMECEDDTFYGGYIPDSIGSMAYVGVHINEGPASFYVSLHDMGILNDPDLYENDWQHIEYNLYELINIILDYWEDTRGWVYDYIPEFNIGWVMVSNGVNFQYPFLPGEPDGDCSNPFNPVPWSGFMIDNVQLKVVESVEVTEIVSSKKINTLAPGEQATVQLTWEDAGLCHHSLIGDVNVDDDILPDNDRCSDSIKVVDEEKCFDGGSQDLTTVGDCLWHVCTNRENGDDFFAWTGIFEETWAHYINNMDDSIVSPTINVTGFADEGVAVNFTHYYELAAGDKGEVYIQKSGEWHKLAEYTGSSGGGFEYASLFIPEELCSDFFRLKFRFKSDDEFVSEGWFFDDIYIVDVTDDGVAASLAVPCDHTWIDIGTVPYSDTNQDYWVFDEMECVDDSYVLDELKFYCLEVSLNDPVGSTYEIVISDTDTADGDVYAATPTSGTVVGLLWGSYDIWEVTFTGLGIPVDTNNNYLCVRDTDPSHLMAWMPATGGDDYSYQVGSGSNNHDMSFFIEPDNAYEPTYGDVIPALMWLDLEGDNTMPHGIVEDFERGVIDPWVCYQEYGGNYWKYTSNPATLINEDEGYDFDECDDCLNGWYVFEGHTSEPSINNAYWIELDLSHPTLGYAELDFVMDYSLHKESIFIELSADWEPGTDMNDATWTAYFVHTPGDNYGNNLGGWTHIDDIVGDDRFALEEYLGNVVYLRFRVVTDGDGAGIGNGWAIDALTLMVKRFVLLLDDFSSPVTESFFNEQTGQVTLVAVDYPLNKNSGINVTFYKLDGGAKNEYIGPFIIDEGTHTVEYWSVDNVGNVESINTATYTFDTTEPMIELTAPEPGVYFLGNKMSNFGSKAICIGKVPIAVDANDGTGSGIARVLFEVDGDTGYDVEAPYEYTFRGMNFGELTIKATAIDNKGLISEPAEMTITCFSLGLL